MIVITIFFIVVVVVITITIIAAHRIQAKGQKEAGVSDKFYKIDRGSVITAVMSLPPKEFSLLGNRS